MSNPFDRPRGGVFSTRVAQHNPHREADRAREEARRLAEANALRQRPRTLFDVQDYLVSVGRKHLMPNIATYNQPAVENSLAQDLDAALAHNDLPLALRLRRMILIASTEGFPGSPRMAFSELQQTIKDQLKNLYASAADFKRSGEYDEQDQQSDDRTALAWGVLLALFADPHGQHDPETLNDSLRVLDQALYFAYRDMNAPGTTKMRHKAKAEYERLREARIAAYWLTFRALDHLGH